MCRSFPSYPMDNPRVDRKVSLIKSSGTQTRQSWYTRQASLERTAPWQPRPPSRPQGSQADARGMGLSPGSWLTCSLPHKPEGMRQLNWTSIDYISFIICFVTFNKLMINTSPPIRLLFKSFDAHAHLGQSNSELARILAFALKLMFGICGVKKNPWVLFKAFDILN